MKKIDISGKIIGELFIEEDTGYSDVCVLPGKHTALVAYENNGEIMIPDKPGLGLSMNEEACESYPFQPIDLRHYKGTLTNVRPAGNTGYYFEGLPNID